MNANMKFTLTKCIKFDSQIKFKLQRNKKKQMLVYEKIKDTMQSSTIRQKFLRWKNKIIMEINIKEKTMKELTKVHDRNL